ITSVEIRSKRGRFHNELTQFRYDVVLYVDGAPGQLSGAAEPWWIDWADEELERDDLAHRVRTSGRARIGVRGIPNARVATLVRELAVLASNADGARRATVADLRARVGATSGLDPEDLWDLERSLPYAIDLSPSLEDSASLDAMFTSREVTAASGRTPRFPR